MKFKTTQREIKRGYSNIIAIGYCNAQFLLNCCDPVAYTSRREGWGSDIYTFGSVAISTGYAPFGNIRPKYDTVKKYEDQARKVVCNTSDFDKRQKALASLIEDFIKEVTAA